MRSVTFCCCKDENLDEDAILYLRLINMTAVAVAFRFCSKYFNRFCISFAISECEMHSFVSSTSWIISDFLSESRVNPSQATENQPSAVTSFVSSPAWISFQRWNTPGLGFWWQKVSAIIVSASFVTLVLAHPSENFNLIFFCTRTLFSLTGHFYTQF